MDREDNFKKLVRVLFRFLKTRHHLAETKRGPGPRSLDKAATWLKQLVRPAQPNDSTQELLVGNAANWHYTSLQILWKHYEDTLEGLTTQIQALDLSEFDRAWEVATKWVRRGLKTIKEGTITRATLDLKDLIKSQKQQEGQGESSAMETVSEGEREAEEAMRRRFRAELRQELREELRQEIRRELEHELRAEQQLGTEPEAEPLVQPQVGLEVEPESQPESRPKPQRQNRPRKQENPIRRSPVREVQGASHEPRMAPQTVEAEEDLSILEQAESNLFEVDDGQVRNPGGVSDEDWEALLNDEFEEGVRIDTPEKRKGEEQLGPVKRQRPVDSEAGAARKSLMLQEEGTGESLHQRIEHHGKKGEWSLNPLRPILVLGDSNVHRIPVVKDDRIQVVAYPGARWGNALNILQQGTPVTQATQAVVLSFGTNDALLGKLGLSIAKTIKGALGAAQKKFPNARVLVPLINFSAELPSPKRGAMRTLNNMIHQTGMSVPALSGAKFVTEADNIHWTSQTGAEMLGSWLAALN